MKVPPKSTRVSAALALALIVGGALVPAAATPSASGRDQGPPQPLAQVLRKVVSKPLYAHATWGLNVLGAKSGNVLFQHNGQALFVTGSIMKVFSTATALHHYGLTIGSTRPFTARPQ